MALSLTNLAALMPTAPANRTRSRAARKAQRVVIAASVSSLLSLSGSAHAADPPAATPPAAAVPVAPAAAAPKPVKTLLAYKAQVGQVRKGKGTATLAIDMAGQKLTIDSKEVGKVTYTKVEPNGNITFERVAESSETVIQGQRQPEEKPETSTYVIRPDGSIVSYKTTDIEPDKQHLSVRLYNASTPVFSDKAVGVGDKWTYNFKADDTLGQRAARGDYEIVAMEKAGATDVVKIKYQYAETADKGITARGTFTVEVNSGDTLVAGYELTNIPLGDPGEEQMATGMLAEARIEGGPFKDSRNSPDASRLAEKKEKTIDEVVKEYEKLPGLLTLYRKKESGKETLYAEVREDQLNKLLLLQATASTGNAAELIAGDPISDTLFKLQKQDDDKIMIVVPNWRYRADAKTPMGRAVKRSFPDGYLQSFKIEAKQADRKSYLIDLSDFFRSDFAQITQALAGGGLGSPTAGMSYMMDREKTGIDSIKNFPENLVVFTNYHFNHNPRGGGIGLADQRSLPLRVGFNLFALPNDSETFVPTNGFKPRRADGRIGYFMTEWVNFDDDSRRDQTDRFILRWDLHKKNPTALVSDPVKPITFWLDNAIPVEYRDAVKRGVLAWNKSFEKIGFKNAIQVNQMPDDADWDHADMRYNVIRWVVTPDESPRNGVAIALFRQNPLTGQILNAGISVDSSWTRYGKLQRRKLIEPAAVFSKAAGPSDAQLALMAKQAEAKNRTGKHNAQLSADYCQIGDGLQEKARFGDLALRLASPSGLTPEREKKYTEQLLTETVMHEFGHILGLSHNFIGSTELSLDQLSNSQLVHNQGISASIMDYNAFNISAIKKPSVDFYSQAVGTYDNWAVTYGYSEFAPTDEKTSLARIASQSNLPGHAYQSDAEAMVGIDPRVTQYDMGSDPLAYWERMMRLSRYLMTGLEAREPKRGESFWEFTQDFNQLLGTYARAAGTASRYIGGVKLNRNYKGDARESATTDSIPVADQKRALNLLNTYVFAPTALQFPERYFTKMTTDPFAFSFSQDFPMADQISGIQKSAITRLFSPSVLKRVANSEYKKGGDATRALTLPTLFNSVSSNVWAEVVTHKNVPTMRRQLQRAYLDTLIDLALKPGAPEDARMIAWQQLRSLKTKLATAQSVPKLDEYTRIHLADSQAKVTRTLNAQTTLGGAQDGDASALLQMLMGKEAEKQAAEKLETAQP